ncbi:hypothetical protein [Clostridium sp.]|uniref:hypothetical protein n=1 Tax=Clostridium sp. TaxID=1506 RepID=UPI002612CEEC|nr:hypothetical protein [Clostridium sp.]
MNAYTILFYLNEEHNHDHEEHEHNCQCGEDHNHDHNEGCGCGNHEHKHDDSNHEHGDDCGCGHDHSNTRDDYDIVAIIKTLGSWANFMPDSYLVKSEFSAEEIANKIESVLIPGDLLFVTKVAKDDVASLTPGVVDWIKAN